MRKFLFILLPCIILYSSCGRANKETIDKLANDMCAAMELYNEDKPSSIILVKKALQEIAEDSGNYYNVTESQLENAMKTKCPDGLKKYLLISNAK